MSRAAAKTKLATPAAPSGATRVRGNRAGTIVSWADENTPIVDFPGNPHGPLAARTLDVTPQSGRPREHREVLLAFESERSDRPIVVGFFTPATSEALRTSFGEPSAGTIPLEAVVDGKRVVIEGQDEIVLKCGLASVTLRRNGRVVVRGTYVETRANGVNRIRGGTVEIN